MFCFLVSVLSHLSPPHPHSDMALLWDRKFKKHVYRYAADEGEFLADFAAAFSKLLELGVPRGGAATA